MQSHDIQDATPSVLLDPAGDIYFHVPHPAKSFSEDGVSESIAIR